MVNLKLSDNGKFHKEFQRFISTAVRDLLIICPYIKTNSLDIILENKNNIKTTIITTWNLRDLQFGSSELKLYKYCKNNNIYLFLNNRIHLKAIINDYSNCLFGSANITKLGLALNSKYNYELSIEINELKVEEIKYFKKILKNSILLTDSIYEKFKLELNKLDPIKDFKEVDLSDIKSDSEFLISALPMSRNIEVLYKIYSGNSFEGFTNEEIQCAIHDIVLYDIPKGLEEKEFISYLKNRFFESEFIIKLLEFIDDEKYFGAVKAWIQNNCQDVPVPSRRSLTKNIQVLYQWIVKLSDGKYNVDRPHYSERIFRVKEK